MSEITWKEKTAIMRKAIADSVLFSGPQKEDCMVNFLFLLAETDTFHPFDTDFALNKMDEDDIFSMFCDVENNVLSFYADPWNHPPGYQMPEVAFDPEFATDTFFKELDKVVA